MIADPPFHIYQGGDDLDGPQQNGEVPDEASKRAGRLAGPVVEDLEFQDALAHTLAQENILIEVQGENKNIYFKLSSVIRIGSKYRVSPGVRWAFGRDL